MIKVKPLEQNLSQNIQSAIDSKTKPIGSLGQLEVLAKQLQLIAIQRVKRINKESSETDFQVRLTLNKPTMLVFAGDHGINAENLSIAPSDVTRQMVMNFLHGGAAINCFCRSNRIALTVIDCGILKPVSEDEMPRGENDELFPKFLSQRLGEGTRNFAVHTAMSEAQLKQGFIYGQELVASLTSQGVEVILLGEMGIANTSSATAIMAALTPYSVEQCVGRGTGISDEQVARKTALINQAIQRIQPILPLSESNAFTSQQVADLLSEVGGFEIVQMVATILAAAAANIPVVIDGFIVSVAALVAVRMQANVSDYLIYAHVSDEKAHLLLLTELAKLANLSTGRSPALLSLGLRLGEGTGAALALPLLQAAASFYNDMASFEEAGVTV